MIINWYDFPALITDLPEAFSSWSKHSPKNTSERKELMKKCDKKCFLKPTEMKFPVCRKDCSVDCEGLVAARIRARQLSYPEVDKKVSQYYKKHGCSKKNQKGGLIPGSANRPGDDSLTFRRSSGRLASDGSIYHVVSHGNEGNYYPRNNNGVNGENVQRGGGFFDWLWSWTSLFNMVGGAYVYNVETDECPICKGVGPDEDFGGDQVQICSSGHYAHPECIANWYGFANTCPVCNVNVSDFPLYKSINPEGYSGPRYNPDNYAPGGNVQQIDENLINSVDLQGLIQRNNYQEALEFFRSPLGRAYVQMMLDINEEEYNRMIYFGNADEETVMVSDHFITEFLGENQSALNVANALFDAFNETGEEYLLTQHAGHIIDMYTRDIHVDSSSNFGYAVWLHNHGYSASSEFMDNSALNRQTMALNWYLNTYRPNPRGPEINSLLEMLDTPRHTNARNIILSYVSESIHDYY
jgi:hypothetical protein